MSKKCPSCLEIFVEDNLSELNFCPYCEGTRLISLNEENSTMSLGNANAINGGVNINQSRNVVSNATHYHATTIQERAKSELELKNEAVSQLRKKANQLFSETGRLDSLAIGQLRPLAQELGIDNETFKKIVKEVRSNSVNCFSKLSSANARYLAQGEQAIKSNDPNMLSSLLDRFEAIANISQDEQVQYIYHLMLTLVNPDKCIEQYEQHADENYWRSFWATVSYIRLNKFAEATKALVNFNPIRFEKPEEDSNLLEAYFNLMNQDHDSSKDFLDEIIEEPSKQLIPFHRAIENFLFETDAETLEERFYLESFLPKPVCLEETPCLTETPNTEVEDTPNVIEEIAEEVIEEVQPEIVEETPAIAEEPAPVVEEKTDTTEKIATEVTKVSMSDLKKMTIEEKFEYASLAFNNDEVDKADICIEVFRKLANEGFAPAQYQLAECYFSGFGVKQNYQQSATWHNKAAEQGFAMSQLMLGYKYELAQGCIQNYQNAAKWYRKAADQNEPEAQYRLGLLYIDGNGVVQNEKKGSALIESAASQGHTEATEWIKAKSGKKIQKNESTKEPIKQEFAINNVKVSTDGCSDIYFNINWTGPKKTDKNVEIRLYKGKKGWLDSCIYPPRQARLKTDSSDLSLKSKVLNKCTFYIELGDVEYTQDGREKKWEVLATYGPFTPNIYFEHRIIGKNKLEIR